MSLKKFKNLNKNSMFNDEIKKIKKIRRDVGLGGPVHQGFKKA
jgi:hypothetical protein